MVGQNKVYMDINKVLGDKTIYSLKGRKQSNSYNFTNKIFGKCKEIANVEESLVEKNNNSK